MASIKKGDLYLVNFDSTIGSEIKRTRPGVIISNNINNANSPILSIAPLTSNVTNVFSFEVLLPKNTKGLKSTSKVMVNQARAVDKARLAKNLGAISKKSLGEINQALKLHYDLD